MLDKDDLSRLFDELFPIMRSITGEGTCRTLEILRRYMPLAVETVPSGSRVFDWTVPPVWQFRSARLTGPGGEVITDAAKSTLAVMNYSEPVDRVLDLEELQPHLHSIPAVPEATPYVTSYYKRNWGFCLPQRVRDGLKPGKYHAHIDSGFTMDGGVQFAECVLPGESEQEILLTSYVCHPSMANNELSGPLALAALYQRIKQWKRRRFTYRFLLNPETIGALCFLSRRGEHMRRTMTAGMVLTCLGGISECLTYKFSRSGTSLFDRLVNYLTACPESGRGETGASFATRPFLPLFGSDERQYNSPGFNLPFGLMTRDVPGEAGFYHNSLDDKAYMNLDRLMESIDSIERFLSLAELGSHYKRTNPFGEPQLGRYDLYPTTNSPHTRNASSDDRQQDRTFLNRVLFTLNYADGQDDGIRIAERSWSYLSDLRPVIETLEANDLIRFTGRPDNA